MLRHWTVYHFVLSLDYLFVAVSNDRKVDLKNIFAIAINLIVILILNHFVKQIIAMEYQDYSKNNMAIFLLTSII